MLLSLLERLYEEMFHPNYRSPIRNSSCQNTLNIQSIKKLEEQSKVSLQ